MFCSECGLEINDKAVICPYCGCKTANFTESSSPVKRGDSHEGYYNTRIAAALCFFLGGLGIHKFYMGSRAIGIIIILYTIFFGALTGGIALIPLGFYLLIESILLIMDDDEWALRKDYTFE